MFMIATRQWFSVCMTVNVKYVFLGRVIALFEVLYLGCGDWATFGRGFAHRDILVSQTWQPRKGVYTESPASALFFFSKIFQLQRSARRFFD